MKMVKVHPLCDADATAATQLCEQLGYPATVSQVRARLKALGQSQHDAVFGAYEGDYLLGWVHVQGRHTVELEPFAEVCALVVDEQIRGRGVGHRLMEAAETWARGGGYDTVYVRSNVKRERTHKFYEDLGYAQTKTSHV